MVVERSPSVVSSPRPNDLAQLIEVFFHLLTGFLYELGIIQDVQDLVGGSVAANSCPWFLLEPQKGLR